MQVFRRTSAAAGQASKARCRRRASSIVTMATLAFGSGLGTLVALGSTNASAATSEQLPQTATLSVSGSTTIGKVGAASWDGTVIATTNGVGLEVFVNGTAYRLLASNPVVSVAVSGDGSTVVAGVPAAGTAGAILVVHVSALVQNPGGYTPARINDTTSGDRFGTSVGVSVGGAEIAVGAPGAAAGLGEALLLSEPVGGWVTASSLTGVSHTLTEPAGARSAVDGFGSVVALSGDGSTAAVSAPSNDDAASIDSGANGTGAVYVYSAGDHWDPTNGGQTYNDGQIVGSSDFGITEAFGSALSLSGDGDALAVVAPGDSAQVFSIAPGAVWQGEPAWNQLVDPDASAGGDNYGTSVSMSSGGGAVAVGDSSVDGGPGDVSIYSLSYSISPGENPNLPIATYADPVHAADSFGSAVALTAGGHSLIVGAPDANTNAGALDAFGVGLDAATSTITAVSQLGAPAGYAATGDYAELITVQAVDVDGQEITSGDDSVDLTVTAGDLDGNGTTDSTYNIWSETGEISDDNSGAYVAYFTAPSTVGTVTISGSIDDIALVPATLDVVAPTPASVSFTSGESTATVGQTYTPTFAESGGLTPALYVDGATTGWQYEGSGGDGICTPNASGTITFSGAGTCVLDAVVGGFWLGDIDYTFDEVQQSITVSSPALAPTPVTTSTPTPVSPAAGPAQLVLESSTATANSSSVSVDYRCLVGRSCTATAELSVARKVPGHKGAYTHLILARASISVPSGQTEMVKFDDTSAGKRALSRRHLYKHFKMTSMTLLAGAALSTVHSTSVK